MQCMLIQAKSVVECILQVVDKARRDRRLALHRPQPRHLYKLALYALQLRVLDRPHQLQPHRAGLHVHAVAGLDELPLLPVDEGLGDGVDGALERLQVRDVLQVGGQSGQAGRLLLAVQNPLQKQGTAEQQSYKNKCERYCAPRCYSALH